MKSIIITGGTRGIGYGLADAFLSRGCAVTICGRDAQSLEVAHQSLTRVYSTDKVASYTCDVRNYDQLQGLWASPVKIKLIKAEILAQYGLATQRSKKVSSSIA